MDFEQGIPPEHRTLVAVPTMLTSAAGIEHLLEGLEVRYLANRDPCLHFALLTDFVDAAAETLPGDAELVRLAREGIERLEREVCARFAATSSISFTARAAGTPRKASGWATSASAASWPT